MRDQLRHHGSRDGVQQTRREVANKKCEHKLQVREKGLDRPLSFSLDFEGALAKRTRKSVNGTKHGKLILLCRVTYFSYRDPRQDIVLDIHTPRKYCQIYIVPQLLPALLDFAIRSQANHGICKAHRLAYTSELATSRSTPTHAGKPKNSPSRVSDMETFPLSTSTQTRLSQT